MWSRLFDPMLKNIVRNGRLDVVMPDGTRTSYGKSEADPVVVHLHDADLPRRFMLDADMTLGEAYMDGRLTIEGDDLDSLLALMIRNITSGNSHWAVDANFRLRKAMRKFLQNNHLQRARQNVAHHYDLSGELYDLFLDKDRQYSCAYFRSPDDTLDQAQEQKKAHIARKLLIEPGMRVLDIGCGWGGMALTLARDYGAEVVGVTLSKEQHAIATQRAAAAGLSGQVSFHLRDYRKVKERFDRIVSVGMFEHVGVPHYGEFFGQVHDLLKPDGVALLHTIGHRGPPAVANSWMSKYIFPGGYAPSLSEVSRVIDEVGLYHCDVESWRHHYAMTLRHWHDRFMARVDEARAIYDDRFCRMWRYYLKSMEYSFSHGNLLVYQFQLSHRNDAVPLTRDYLYADSELGMERHRHAAE